MAVNHLVASSSLARGAKNTKPDLLRIGLFSLFYESGRSAAWLARLPWEQEVVSSNLTAPTKIIKGFRFLPEALFLFYLTHG